MNGSNFTTEKATTDQSSSRGDLPSQNRAIASLATVIFAGSLASRVLGLVREQLAARHFGAGDAIAAYTVADNINTLLFDLLASGMTQSAIVPVLAVMALAGTIGLAELRKSLGALLGIGLLGSTIFVIFGIAFAPSLIDLMTNLTGDGSSRAASTTDLAVESLRIILPSLIFLTAATVLTAALYALERPAAPAFGSTARNGAIVVAILLFSQSLGVRSMAVGVVVGALLLVAIQFAGLKRARMMPRLSLNIHDPAVSKIGRLYGPVLVGLFVSSAVVVIDRNLAWKAQSDAIGAMRYATALVQLVLGLVAAAVSLAALPGLSRAHSQGNENEFNERLRESLVLVSLLIIPAVLGMAALAEPLVTLLFEHGATGAEASRLIVIALLLYLPGHLLSGYDQVLIFAFYARQNTRLPVAVGVLASASFLVIAPLLADRYQMAGLVIANSIQIGIHTVIMVWLSGKQFGQTHFSTLAPTLWTITTAAGLASLLMLGAYLGLSRSVITSDQPGVELLALFVPALMGFLVYVVLVAKTTDPVLRMAVADIVKLFNRFRQQNSEATAPPL